MNPVDQHTLMIRLPAFHLDTQSLAGFLAKRFDVGKRVVPILRGFALAQQIQIGSVEDEYFLHDLTFSI
jgi:hypothetical protein